MPKMVNAMRVYTYDVEEVMESQDCTEDEALAIIEDWAEEDLGGNFVLIDAETGEEL